MNKNVKKILNDMKRTSPHLANGNVYGSIMDLDNIVDKLSMNDDLDESEVKRLIDAIHVCKAYALYTMPLLEPITYCSLDEVKLVGRDTYNDLILVKERTDSFFSHLGQLLMEASEKTRQKVQEDFDKHLLRYRHPYQ